MTGEVVPSIAVDSDAEFTVTLASSGASYLVPRGQSILEVLLENGLDVPHSCCAGVCGTCVMKLLEGEADHRDGFLYDDEQNKNIAVCVSRARSGRLVIDF
jgi:ferredoxin